MRHRQFVLTALIMLMGYQSFADDYPRNYSIDIIHYAFELKLLDNTDEITGKATISILFKADDISQVRLDLINRTEQRSGKGMVVESVTLDNANLDFKHQNDAIFIQLGKPAERNKIYKIVVQYKGVPAGGLKIGPTKYGDRSFFCENWPNNARHWLPTVDHPYDKATSEFIVTAPVRYKVISNGLLQEESQVSKDFKLTHWKQSVPVSCWLFVLGVAEFAVQYVDQFEGKSIQSWVYPQDREAGFFDFASPTKQVMQFYTEYVGPYVFEKLANVQSHSVSGGMETSSAIFYGEKLITGKADVRLRNVLIHEIAHQWFGNSVTETTWDDAWLSEGFATYFTLLFQEYAYGHDEYIEGLKRNRTNVFNFYKKDSTYSIIDNRSAEKGEVTNIITYQKGAWVLHMLRERMGHDQFRKGIQAYYKKYMIANATTPDFISEMEKQYGQDLKTFFHQWLNRPDVLKISGGWTYDAKAKQVVVSLTQTQSSGFLFNTPIEIQVYEEGSKTPQLLKFELNSKNAQFNIPCSKKPSLVLLDPRTVLLADIDFKGK
ncbi:MAG TPA: M1 family metallopeptidase [Chitinophagaceae bacterium]|nr:M1 family metallopeptidase [Chitinophagaceae bacterium]